MSLLDILKYPHPVLAKRAEEIERIDDQIVELARDMAETMIYACGIGLAAPQVGVSKRLIVVDFGPIDGIDNPKVVTRINPVILQAEGTYVLEEGCLSLPGIQEEIERYAYIKVKSLDLDGNEIVEELSDLAAVVYQHEIDHLDGIVFLDRMADRQKAELIKKKIKKYGYPKQNPQEEA